MRSICPQGEEPWGGSESNPQGLPRRGELPMGGQRVNADPSQGAGTGAAAAMLNSTRRRWLPLMKYAPAREAFERSLNSKQQRLCALNATRAAAITPQDPADSPLSDKELDILRSLGGVSLADFIREDADTLSDGMLAAVAAIRPRATNAEDDNCPNHKKGRPCRIHDKKEEKPAEKQSKKRGKGSKKKEKKSRPNALPREIYETSSAPKSLPDNENVLIEPEVEGNQPIRFTGKVCKHILGKSNGKNRHDRIRFYPLAKKVAARGIQHTDTVKGELRLYAEGTAVVRLGDGKTKKVWVGVVCVKGQNNEWEAFNFFHDYV